LLAQECGMIIKASTAPELVTLTATAQHSRALADPSESSTGLPGEVESLGLTNSNAP
jgi:hypothetical protein